MNELFINISGFCETLQSMVQHTMLRHSLCTYISDIFFDVSAHQCVCTHDNCVALFFPELLFVVQELVYVLGQSSRDCEQSSVVPAHFAYRQSFIMCSHSLSVRTDCTHPPVCFTNRYLNKVGLVYQLSTCRIWFLSK